MGKARTAGGLAVIQVRGALFLSLVFAFISTCNYRVYIFLYLRSDIDHILYKILSYVFGVLFYLLLQKAQHNPDLEFD